MEELKEKYPIKVIYETLGLLRSGYYKWRSNQRFDKDRHLREAIGDIQSTHNNAYGYRRIVLQLARNGIRLNHKRVLRIRRENGLLSVIRRKKYRGGRRASDLLMGHIYPNLLSRNFKADAPKQKWVTDVTMVACGGKRLYLSVIVDLFNNEVIAWHMSERNDNELVLTTLQKASRSFKRLQGILLHSD